MDNQTEKKLPRRKFLELVGQGAFLSFISPFASPLMDSISPPKEPQPSYSILGFVEQGDNLNLIAERFGCPLEDLIKANPWVKETQKLTNKAMVAIPSYNRLPDSKDIEYVYPHARAIIKTTNTDGRISHSQGEIDAFENSTGLIFFKEPNKENLLVTPQALQIVDAKFADKPVNEQSKLGATAIFMKTYQPVRILGPGRDLEKKQIMGQTSVEALNKDGQFTVYSSDLRLPKNQPELWISASNGNLPENSVIREELLSSQAGVDYMNSWYRKLGITDIVVPDITIEEFNIVPEGGNPQNQNRGKIDLFLPWIAEKVNTVTGFPLLGDDGVNIINHNYQSALYQKRLLQLIGHEHGAHATHHQFDYVSSYYEIDEDLPSALEHWAQFVSFRSMQAYGQLYDQTTPNWQRDTIWADNLIKLLNEKGLEGEFILMDRGGRGDMAGLAKIFDDEYGTRAFRKWQREINKKVMLDYASRLNINSDTEKQQATIAFGGKGPTKTLNFEEFSGKQFV